ncbi:MAG: adenylate cyclase-like protein [uncultured bacterium]|nr:MAG: adenylate cyclase-like protein [uncultured bacterium]
MPANASETPGLEALKEKIGLIIGGNTVMCLFFDQQCKQIVALSDRKIALSGGVIPPAALFKRQLQFLFRQGQPELSTITPAQIIAHDAEQRRLALSMQQLFKTITPVTLQTNRVVKNFSAQYGGDLDFIYFEFKNCSDGPEGCLAVLRGQEFSTEFMLTALRSQFPRCRVVSRELDVIKSEPRPDILNSGVARLGDRLLITSAADQRFIRHVLHAGGIALKEDMGRNMPFLQYHLPMSSFQHQFAGIRSGFVTVAAILLSLSGLYCFRAGLFGISLTGSFKKRIMFTTAIAAIFPFTFFSASFYLHLQYDEFLGKINLLQHLNTRLALLGNELDQYFANLEGDLALFLQQIDKSNYLDETAVQKIFAAIGEQIPISRIFLQRLDGVTSREFASRFSGQRKDTNAAVESFFPLRTLQLLREPEPVERTRQDALQIPGENVRVTLIGKALISNGSFYNLDQAKFPVWLANFKVIDKEAPDRLSVLGLVFTRLEAAPLIADFLSKSRFADSGFQEEYGNYRIRYAFFPVDRTGSSHIWNGSGHVEIAVMKSAAARPRSETVVLRQKSGAEEFVVNKLNNGLPHMAVALAQPRGLVPALNSSLIIGLGSLFYLFLLLLLSGKLLDTFFVSPVIELARNAEQIARGGDSWSLKLSTGDELEQLNASFAQMVKGLQQRNMLKDYVSEDAYSDLATSEGRNLAPGGEYRESTILFAAIKDFHQIAENLTPQQTVELLNLFTTIGDRIVKTNNGSIDKILNQTLMLVFRENPEDSESHALRAARTAIQLAEATKAQGLSGIYAGIASGTVISGKIGSYQGKLDFTVIGNPVNLAARLKSEAVDSTTGVIISGSTMRLLKGIGRVNFLRRCSLKGKAREYNIYELIDLR